jgi:hypothetical protein
MGASNSNAIMLQHHDARTPATVEARTAETPATAWGPATARGPATEGARTAETPATAWGPATAMPSCCNITMQGRQQQQGQEQQKHLQQHGGQQQQCHNAARSWCKDASNSRGKKHLQQHGGQQQQGHHAATSWCKDASNRGGKNSRNTCNSKGASNSNAIMLQHHDAQGRQQQ